MTEHKTRKTRTAFAAGAAAVALVAGSVTLGGCSSLTPSTPPTSVSQSNTNSTEADELADEAPSLDIEIDRALLNEGLCWMAQVFQSNSEETFDFVSDDSAKVEFAATYLGLQDTSNWERGEYDGYHGGGPQGTSNARISTQLVDEVSEEFFGSTPDYDKLVSQRYTYGDDDYIYFGTTAPVGQTARDGAATQVTSLNDGKYEVVFESFTNAYPYAPHSTDFYEMTPVEMANSLGVGGPVVTGVATVSVEEDDNGKHLIFEKYRIDGLYDYMKAPTLEANPEGEMPVREDEAPSSDVLSTEAPYDFAAAYKQILDDKASDRRMGDTTMSMLEAGSEYIEREDQLLNDLYNYVASFPQIDTTALAADQEAWKADKAAAVEAAQAEAAGGSMSGLNAASAQMEWYGKRIEELLALV